MTHIRKIKNKKNYKDQVQYHLRSFMSLIRHITATILINLTSGEAKISQDRSRCSQNIRPIRKDTTNFETLLAHILQKDGQRKTLVMKLLIS